MSKEYTIKFLTGLSGSPEKVLSRRIELTSPEQNKYKLGIQENRFIDVDEDKLTERDRIKLTLKAPYPDAKSVQFLPWAEDLSIYILLQSQPPTFFTDTLTGCYLAFDLSKNPPKVSHLNLTAYSEPEKQKTLLSFSDCHLLCEYLGSLVVFGVLKQEWQFFYRGAARGGRLTMTNKKSKYGTKSVVLS